MVTSWALQVQPLQVAGEVLHDITHPAIILLKVALSELKHVGLLVDAHAGGNCPCEPAQS